MKTQKVELYSDDFGKTLGTANRYIDAYISGDKLVISLQDIGPLAHIYCYEDERGVTVSLEEVKKVLSVKSNYGLLKALKERFNKEDALDKFTDFANENKIKANHFVLDDYSH
jgi:hypothetical protein